MLGQLAIATSMCDKGLAVHKSSDFEHVFSASCLWYA
jgi:hypothetical protein